MLCLFKNVKWIVTLGVLVIVLLSISKTMADVAIVVHPSNTSNFDKTTIKRIFLGKVKSFSNGRPAILISAEATDPATEIFNKNVIGKSNSQVNAYWAKMMFTGKGSPPKKLALASDIIAVISTNPDAIGFIDAATATEAIKVVATF